MASVPDFVATVEMQMTSVSDVCSFKFHHVSYNNIVKNHNESYLTDWWFQHRGVDDGDEEMCV